MTSHLIIRLIKNIKQIFAVLNAFEAAEGAFSEDVTLGKILTDEEVRKKFGDVFFGSVSRNNPVAV